MKRWALPTIYFVLCEILDLLYELGLVGLMMDVVWVFSAFILVAITSPAIEIARWVEQHMATLLNLPFNQHWFLPRWLATQSAILTCTFVLVVFTWAFTKNGHPKNGATNP